jgi:integrase
VDADRWLRDQLASLDRGEWLDPQARRTTVGEFAGRWLEMIVNLKPKTRDGYESLLRVHVLPAFGSWRVSDVDRASVRAWLSSLQADGLSPSRTRQARTVLSQILSTAMEAGALKSNPTRGVKITGASSRDMLALNADEVACLAEEAESLRPGSGTLILLLAYGGLRWGEAVALRRGRCELLRSRILIKESVSEVNGKLHFGPTKTHQDRVIILPGILRDRLAAHLADRVSDAADAFVFPDNAGGALRNSNWRARVWKPACEISGMPDGLRIHDMRHTAASLLVSSGANVKAVQRHLGHASAAMTLDRYSHLFTDDLEALADRLETTLSQANASSARPKASAEVVELSA